MLLSVVIPAWQEARRIERLHQGVRSLRAALPYAVEVLVVDDGSTDGTGDLAARAGLQVLRQPHRGKGAAVRAGMLATRGVYRLLADADWSMPPEQVLAMLPPVLTGHDVVIASRETHGAQRTNEPAARHIIGRLFNMAVQSIVLPGVEDSQCGFKVFRAEAARAIFSRCREDGWAFDVEVLALARKLGMRVAEVPIDWRHDPDTRVRPLLDAPSMLASLLRVRARLSTGAYDDAIEPDVSADPPRPSW